MSRERKEGDWGTLGRGRGIHLDDTRFHEKEERSRQRLELEEKGLKGKVGDGKEVKVRGGRWIYSFQEASLPFSSLIFASLLGLHLRPCNLLPFLGIEAKNTQLVSGGGDMSLEKELKRRTELNKNNFGLR